MRRPGERGSANLKFLIVMMILGACAYAGYRYIPVAFQASAYKDMMQHYADVAATQGYPPSWVSEQLMKNGADYEIPANAIITPVSRDNRIEVRVQYTQPVQLPGFVYNYEFDHTAKSATFLSIK